MIIEEEDPHQKHVEFIPASSVMSNVAKIAMAASAYENNQNRRRNVSEFIPT